MGPTQASTNNMWLQNKLSPPFREPVLHAVNIKIRKGELIGVVGKVLFQYSFLFISIINKVLKDFAFVGQRKRPFYRLGLENLHSFLACWESSGLRGWKLNLTQIWTNKRWRIGAERLPMWVNNRGFKTWPSGENITRHQYLDSSFYLQREHSFWSGGG